MTANEAKHDEELKISHFAQALNVQLSLQLEVLLMLGKFFTASAAHSQGIPFKLHFSLAFVCLAFVCAQPRQLRERRNKKRYDCNHTSSYT